MIPLLVAPAKKVAVACAFLCLAVGSGAIPAQPSLMPAPWQARFAGGVLDLRGGVRIALPPDSPARLREIAEILRDGLRENGVPAELGDLPPVDATVAVSLVLRPAAGAAEAYTLRVGSTIEVAAADSQGLLWGIQTLLQCVDTSAGRPAVFRGEIDDRPSRPWRALLLDPARSFLSLNFLRRTICVMSAYKMNVLHLHLTDDQAWRFELKAFPKVNRPGEPYYTQDELRDLVAFARRYGIEIVPEFDFPGHAMTAVRAYPELDCGGVARPTSQAILCPGKPFTWLFIEKVVAEAAAVFPSDYLHLGADEPFAIKQWETSPDCQRRMKLKGATTIAGFYNSFVTDLDDMAKRHGKKLIVWSDAIAPGAELMPPRDIVLDAWVRYKQVAALAGAGYTLINSSNTPLYLTSIGLREGLPLAAVREWDARRFGSPDAKRGDKTARYRLLPAAACILGGQACAFATEQGLMESRLYPRLLAVAENLWSEGRQGSLADFEARFAAGQASRLRRLGVPDYAALPLERLFDDPSLARGWLRTARDYRDFHLAFEERADAIYDQMGVFLRCAPDEGTLSPPSGYAVQMAPSPGDVLSRGLRSLRGWNRFEVVARGPVVTLTVDGGLAWSKIDPAPRSGAISLDATGPGREFRDVRVRPLAPDVAGPGLSP